LYNDGSDPDPWGEPKSYVKVKTNTVRACWLRRRKSW
jgi:hypothetical protein